MTYVLLLQDDESEVVFRVAVGATKKEAENQLERLIRAQLKENDPDYVLTEQEILECVDAVRRGEPDAGFSWEVMKAE